MGYKEFEDWMVERIRSPRLPKPKRGGKPNPIVGASGLDYAPLVDFLAENALLLIIFLATLLAIPLTNTLFWVSLLLILFAIFGKPLYSRKLRRFGGDFR